MYLLYLFISLHRHCGPTHVSAVFVHITTQALWTYSCICCICSYHYTGTVDLLMYLLYLFISLHRHCGPTHVSAVFVHITTQALWTYSCICCICSYHYTGTVDLLMYLLYLFISLHRHCGPTHVSAVFVHITTQALWTYTCICCICSYHNTGTVDLLMYLLYLFISQHRHCGPTHVSAVFVHITTQALWTYSCICCICLCQLVIK